MIGARYMKHYYKFWLLSHIIIGSIITVVTLISVLRQGQFEGLKGISGLFNLILLIALSITGILDLVYKCNKKYAFKSYTPCQWIHRISGWGAHVFAFIASFIGMFWIGSPRGLTAAFTALNVLFGILIVVIEIGYKRGVFAKKIKLGENTMEAYNYQRLRQEIEHGRQLMVLDNKVIDLQGFAKYHPGGRFLIQSNYGSECGRYFYGVYAKTKNFPKFKHSAYSLKKFQDKVVGTVMENVEMYQSMFEDPDSRLDASKLLLLSKEGCQKLSSRCWKIVDRQQITTLITRLTFSNSSKRKILLNDLKSWGKHFKFESQTQNGKKIRLYTFSFALGSLSYQIHKDLLNSWQNNEQIDKQYSINEMVEGIDAFPKLYDYKRAYSRFLHRVPLDSHLNSFTVEGPLGIGLGLEYGDNGNYLAISAGTGIVPFIDLAFYLFRKNVYKASQKRNKVLNAFEDDDFNMLGDGFKFTLWASFRSEDEVVAKDILEELEMISKNEGFDNFSFNLRLSYRGEARWDQKYIKENVNVDSKRIFVRGTQEFNWMIEDYLWLAGYNKKDVLHI